MTIRTKPIFYYDYVVTANDIYINFDDGLGERSAKVRAGRYSFSDLANAVSFALNEVGSQEYSVTTNRQDRTYEINANDNFDLLFNTGSNAGLSVASKIGFNSSDKTSSNTYQSDYAAGKVYRPQFWLKSYVPFSHNVKTDNASISEAGSNVEVFTVEGVKRYMEFNISMITDLEIGGEFENTNAVSEVLDFLNYAITKGDMEYMENENDINSYNKVMLERLPGSSDGTGFKLKELVGRGLVDFYETGIMSFREKN